MTYSLALEFPLNHLCGTFCFLFRKHQTCIMSIVGELLLPVPLFSQAEVHSGDWSNILDLMAGSSIALTYSDSWTPRDAANVDTMASSNSPSTYSEDNRGVRRSLATTGCRRSNPHYLHSAVLGIEKVPNRLPGYLVGERRDEILDGPLSIIAISSLNQFS